jgi:hypothetical protein
MNEISLAALLQSRRLTPQISNTEDLKPQFNGWRKAVRLSYTLLYMHIETFMSSSVKASVKIANQYTHEWNYSELHIK